jgi:hypothetical protein
MDGSVIPKKGERNKIKMKCIGRSSTTWYKKKALLRLEGKHCNELNREDIGEFSSVDLCKAEAVLEIIY